MWRLASVHYPLHYCLRRPEVNPYDDASLDQAISDKFPNQAFSVTKFDPLLLSNAQTRQPQLHA